MLELIWAQSEVEYLSICRDDTDDLTIAFGRLGEVRDNPELLIHGDALTAALAALEIE